VDWVKSIGNESSVLSSYRGTLQISSANLPSGARDSPVNLSEILLPHSNYWSWVHLCLASFLFTWFAMNSVYQEDDQIGCWRSFWTSNCILGASVRSSNKALCLIVTWYHQPRQSVLLNTSQHLQTWLWRHISVHFIHAHMDLLPFNTCHDRSVSILLIVQGLCSQPAVQTLLV